jgi:Uma2 family endonuclease
MTTAPSFVHQWIIRQIFLALYPQIDQSGVGLTIWSPIGVFMPQCDPVQPDLLVIHTTALGIIHDRRIDGVPALIIEVLSPGNAEKDTDTKRKAYARAGLPEYWIVRPANRDVLVYTDPDMALGDYSLSQKVMPHDELVSPTLPIRTAISAFFAGAPDTTL